MTDYNTEAHDALRSAIDSIRRGLGMHGQGTDYDPSQIKRARQALSMTREEFAQWLGSFSASTVGRWERGGACPSRGAEAAMKRKLRNGLTGHDERELEAEDAREYKKGLM